MNTRKISKSTVLTMIISLTSAAIWLVMNIPFTPRFSLTPYIPTSGMFLSASLNILLGLILLLARHKKQAFIPFFFAGFPVAYLVTAFTGHLFLGNDFSGPFFYKKILYDCYFFLLEIACILAVAFAFHRPLHFAGTNKTYKQNTVVFADPVFTGNPVTFLTRFSVILFCSGVIGLMLMVLFQYKVSLRTFLGFAWMQLLFAALLGFKEELFFRWLLTHAIVDAMPEIKRSLAGAIALLFVALFWGAYHGFFGEGVGSGAISAAACFIASSYWGYLTLRNGTIRLAFLGHLCIELYGFYLMYLPLLAHMGYIN